MVFRDPAVKRQTLLYSGIGGAEWLLLVAVPATHNHNYSGAPYFLAIFASALVLGVFDPMMPHIRAGLLTVGPGLLLAGWTAPRGDNDGIWILWFPFLLMSIFLTAGCHRIGARRKGAIKA